MLTEDRVGHHPEFREFFVRRFALDSNGLARPGYVLGPLNEADVDSDLWALLRWMIEGAGGQWRVEDLDATGRLYQLTAAGTG